MTTTRAELPHARALPAPGELTIRQQWVALAVLLCGTFLGTVNNNIVNVPLRSIARDLHAPLSHGVLVVIAFMLAFAVSMPLTGWLGDRLGRRDVFLAAMVGLAVGAAGAASAPNLPVLVVFRVVQGLATAAVLPTVMSLLAEIFGPVRRGRALGFWAAVNGIGQAIGPPVGGFVAQWAGWRWLFVPIVPAALATLVAAVRLVPRDRGRRLPLDGFGAATLTLGASLVIAAATVVPQKGVPGWVAPLLGVAGISSLAAFVAGTRRSEHPFVSPRLAREPSYLRSALAVLAQMFCLGSTLLGVPLYLTGLGHTTSYAGAVVFGCPAAMALLAPVAGLLTERFGPRPVLRGGLVVLLGSQAGLAVVLAGSRAPVAAITAVLVVAGIGIALVQTPAATGATRSVAGRAGAGLGVFNLVRFAGSALGAAWVAIGLRSGNAFELIFIVCAVVAAVGLAGTFAGSDAPPTAGESAAAETETAATTG